MTHEGGDVSADASPPSSVRSRSRRWVVMLTVLAVLVVLRPLLLETYTVPSSSMAPTLSPGDRIAVDKNADVDRGDVVVFIADEAFYDGRPHRNLLERVGDFFGVRPSERVYVKRVIGLPGDTVRVDDAGTLHVNDTLVQEPYLADGVSASTTPFSTRVPTGRYFVMGDNRPASDDSRNHLGDPGGGSVRAGDIVGEVVWRYWPSSAWGRVSGD